MKNAPRSLFKNKMLLNIIKMKISETLGNSSNSSEDLGNTSSKSSGKVKQCSPSLRWCFTLHKWTDEEVSSIKGIIEDNCRFGVFSKEYGKTGETPHLQGYIEFCQKARPKGIFGIPRMHWEKAKGNKIQNEEYIKKEYQSYAEVAPSGATAIANEDESKNESIDKIKNGRELWYYPKKFNIDINLFNWQKDLKVILDDTPDDRSIYWIWETKGRAGKTTFQKWVYLNYKKVVVLSGKCEDMKNGIIQYEKTNDCLPEIILINIPRVNENHVSISGMEQVKDMFFFCGKYEGGMVCGPNPHVVVFANEPPDVDTMSADRWKIWNIDHSETLGILHSKM